MSNIKVYSTTTCPWCKVAKDYLRSRQVAFDDIDVGLDQAAAAEMIRVSGQYGVPVITIGDGVVVGFDQAKIDRLLSQSA